MSQMIVLPGELMTRANVSHKKRQFRNVRCNEAKKARKSDLVHNECTSDFPSGTSVKMYKRTRRFSSSLIFLRQLRVKVAVH